MRGQFFTNRSSAFYRETVLGLWQRLDGFAHRLFPEPNTADEAFLYMMEKLEENHWERIRKYKGQGKIESFILSTAHNLLRDYSRSKFSRPRIPGWIKRQGVLWEEAYRLLCMERLPVADVIQFLSIAGPVKRNPAIVEEATSLILERITDCGKAGKGSVTASDETIEKLWRNRDENDSNPEQMLMAAQRIWLTERIATLLFDEQDRGNDIDDRMGRKLDDAIEKLRGALSLCPEERLLLRLVHQEGLSVVAAGRMLGLNANQVSGKFRRLNNRIRKAFKETGIWRIFRAVHR